MRRGLRLCSPSKAFLARKTVRVVGPKSRSTYIRGDKQCFGVLTLAAVGVRTGGAYKETARHATSAIAMHATHCSRHCAYLCGSAVARNVGLGVGPAIDPFACRR